MSQLKNFLRGDYNPDYGWQVRVVLTILIWTGTAFAVSCGAWITWTMWTS